MNEAHDIARQAAARLTDSLGKDLPEEVERAILGAEKEERPITAGEAAAWAGVLLSLANLAWQIYKDLRAMGKKPGAETIRQELREKAALGGHGAVNDEMIEAVVEETARR